MPRMFDILRGKADDEGPDKKGAPPPQDETKTTSEDKPSQTQPVSFPKEILGIKAEAIEPAEDPSLISKKLISIVKKHGVDNQEKTREIYENSVEAIKALLGKIRTKENINLYMDKIYELVDNIFNQLLLGDNILSDIYKEEKDTYYLPYHIVNALILSLVLGLNMGFNKSRLSLLGLASIFCDTGLDSLRGVIDLPRKLSEGERDLVKTHISKSLEIVKKIGQINTTVTEPIAMHHERVNRKGYPRRLNSEGINPYAKILGLVDVYEAITHPRPYRDGMNTHKAVRFLISDLKNEFDADAMKIFINKMSVYPIGSLVRLDTDEIAQVIGVQPGFSLRPIVMIVKGSNGGDVKDRVVVDLSKQDFPSIKDSV